MTNPRRPDDVRLSTADLAAAGERAADRQVDREVDRQVERQAERQPMPAQQGQVPGQVPGHMQGNAPSNVQGHPQGHGHAVADTPVVRQPAQESERSTPLFAGQESDDFRRRWSDIQTGFVDEPRQAVEQADALVASAIKRLAEVFARERGALEQQWARGGDVSTEELRVALRRYRSFFDRLLSV